MNIKRKFYIGFFVIALLNVMVNADTIVWPEQAVKDWNAVDAIWELSPGTPSPVPPGIGDYAYMLSTNEITVNSIVPTIRRLFIDRAVTGYTTVASTVTIVPGGQLTVDSFCQIGYSIDGGTVNVAGGHFIIAATDRSGTYSLVMDDNYAGRINVTAGALSIRNGSQFDFQAGSQGVVTVSGTGLIEFLDGSMMDMGTGALGVTISDTGLIKFVGRNATAEVETLALAGQLTGVLPLASSLYTFQGTANGVGWYYDGSDTYVFAVDTNLRAFLINDPQAVEDVTLRKCDLEYREDGYWTDWNFGKSQVLDTGYVTAVWNQYHAVSLLRFDLRGIACQTVTSAKLKIYKPKNVTQITSEIPFSIYAVKPSNRHWKEGTKESVFQYKGASWNGQGYGLAWAGGASGCSLPGVDHETTPIATAIGKRQVGHWMEFDLPLALVQQWLEQPLDNPGLIIKTPDTVQRGEHVIFYATEHESGKGPQLILNGTAGLVRVPFDTAKPFNPRYVLPPQGTKFNEYLAENNSRYKKWILDPKLNLDSTQCIYPYYWDIVVDGELIVPGGYMPITDMLTELPDLIANNDIAALRKFHLARQRYHHVWEYNKEQRWYESGDVIEVLSPYQAGLLWCRNDEAVSGWNGILTSLLENYPYLSQEDIESRVAEEVAFVESRLGLTPIQLAVIGPVVAQEERIRCEYINLCKQAIEEVQNLLEEENNGPEMIDALSRAMVYHDIFLYHDSFFGGTRWAVIMDNSDMVKFTEWWIDSKYDEFSPSRIGGRWDDIVEYWPETWPAPTLDFYIPEVCQDAIDYGYGLVGDVSGPTVAQPDCYVDIYDLAYLANTWLRCTDPRGLGCEWPF